jgi:hypothetical protein
MAAVAGAAPSANLLSSTVLPNKLIDLIAWVEYNPQTCQLISSGAWEITAPPSKGTTSTRIISGTLANGACPGIQFPFNMLSYTWTSADLSVKVDRFDARWVSPDFVQSDNFVMTLASIDIGTVDMAAGMIGVQINGPTKESGTIMIEFSGATAPATSQTTTATYPGGFSANVPFTRPVIPKGEYGTLKLTWNTSTPATFATSSPPRPWNVLGTIRYSQYNVPVESACSAATTNAYIVDSLSACTFTQTTLRSAFFSQVKVNGTGESLNHGIIKAGAATRLGTACAGQFPVGAMVSNSFLQVASVTGSCNVNLTPDLSVATHRSLSLACSSNLQLVRSDNANQGPRTRHDTCPACNSGFNGTDGHIDSFTASQSCSANQVGDLGNFWTVQVR